jgi:hypothetical protein
MTTPIIDLSAPRTIVITVGKRTYKYNFSPIHLSVWSEYFSAIVQSSERRGQEVIEEFDTSAARLALVDRALQGVEGYTISEELMQSGEWKSKLPIKHRLAVADVLTRVTASDPGDDDELVLGAESVMLSAVWSADEKGVMQQFTQLRHNFASPTAEHFHRYQRDLSRSYIVGGSRGGKTIYRGAQKTLIEIYDELIQSVEGYTLNGQPMGSQSNIVYAMDAYHKVVAAAYLFRPAETE